MKFEYGHIANLDATIADFICAGLKEYRNEQQNSLLGVPAKLCPVEGKEGYAEGREKWLAILDKMIYAFDIAEQPCVLDYKFSFTKDFDIEEGGEDEWERLREDERDWEERCREGRLLFADHFHSLWL